VIPNSVSIFLSLLVGLPGAVLLARLLWRFFSKIVKLADLHPVIISMAEEFKSNGGSTLRDQMNRLEELATSAALAAKDAHDAVVEHAAMMERVLARPSAHNRKRKV
jgi:hypothetical protein